MWGLVPQQLTGFTVNLLFAIAFVILYKRDKKKYLFCWAFALILLVLQNFVNLLPAIGVPQVAALIIGRILNIAASLLSIWGAHAFFGDEPSLLWLPIVFMGFVWSVLGQALNVGYVAAALPVYVVISALLALTAQKVAESDHRGVGHLLTGVGFTIFAIYAFTIPWISREPWFSKLENQLDLFFSVVVIVGVFTLHNEMARAEAEESASRYHSVFTNSIDGIFVTDGEGKIVAANTSLAEIFGYASPELMTGLNYESILQPVDGDRSIFTSERVFNAAVSTKDLSGKDLDLRLNLLRHGDEMGSLIRLEGAVRDLTKESAYRRQLMQSQRLDSMGRLAGAMAHDFNNMLTAIHGNVQLVLLHYSLEKEAIIRLGDTLKAVESAREMTSQLLSFARYQPLATKAIEVNEVVKAVCELMSPTMPSSISLRTDLTKEELFVRAGDTQIEQIVMNLILNGQDALSDSGAINVSLTCDDETVVFEVSDNGKGINEKDLEHIFEPFFTTKSLGKGTGLGLASVYGIVQQLEGTITVNSELNVGTKFTVCLPRCSEMKGIEFNASSPSIVNSDGQLRVLLVEDKDMVRNVAAQMCESLGYEVIKASSGFEALDLASKQEYDILLSDVVMPKMSGPTLAAKLLVDKERLPCVFLSAYAPHPETWPAGCTFLQKPFSINELKESIQGAISHPASLCSAK